LNLALAFCYDEPEKENLSFWFEEEGSMRNERIPRIFAIVILTLLISAAHAVGQPVLRILLTNDDGIDSPGLVALFDKLSALGTVTVAASAKNQSGASHGLTSEGPIWVEETEMKGGRWYTIEALPATCVRLALESLLPEKPDIVVVGINKGTTTGVVTFYSGTVACAREAAFSGLPAIAVHYGKGTVADYEWAAGFVANLVRDIKEARLKPGRFLNVNFPAVPKEQIKGVLVTKQDLRATVENYEKRQDPQGRIFFMRSFKELEPADRGTDIWALANGYISITPLQFDQTDVRAMKGLQSWAGKLWKHLN